MAMFPLGTVLMPGAMLPLHIFEPRYQALVRDCVESNDHEFGVTLIERGSEVGGGDHRATMGAVAQMLQVAELDDGRFMIVCVGTRRIRVNTWLADDPYPMADVDDWPDDDGPDADCGVAVSTAISTAFARVRRLNALATELGDATITDSPEISADPLRASYHLAAIAPIGQTDAYRLLCAPGAVERLALLDQILDDIEAVLTFRLADESFTLPLDDLGDD